MNYIRDGRGMIIGSLETRGDETTIKDKRGFKVGTYSTRDNYTRLLSGKIVGSGNLLTSLL